jgi:hypothetical protein
MRTTSTVFLAVGFVLTAVGAWWNNHSGDGANIGAGLLYMLGIAIGVLGLILLVASFIHSRQDEPHPVTSRK